MLRMAWGLKRLKSSSKHSTNERKSNSWPDLIAPGPWCCKFDGMKPCAGAEPRDQTQEKHFKQLWASHPYFWEHWWIDTWLQNNVRKNRESNIQSDQWESATAWNSLLDIFCLTPLGYSWTMQTPLTTSDHDTPLDLRASASSAKDSRGPEPLGDGSGKERRSAQFLLDWLNKYFPWFLTWIQGMPKY